jgi:hypothetical protein
VSLPEISTGNNISADWMQCFRLFGEFWQRGEKKKRKPQKVQMDFFE